MTDPVRPSLSIPPQTHSGVSSSSSDSTTKGLSTTRVAEVVISSIGSRIRSSSSSSGSSSSGSIPIPLRVSQIRPSGDHFFPSLSSDSSKSKQGSTPPSSSLAGEELLDYIVRQSAFGKKPSPRTPTPPKSSPARFSLPPPTSSMTESEFLLGPSASLATSSAIQGEKESSQKREDDSSPSPSPPTPSFMISSSSSSLPAPSSKLWKMKTTYSYPYFPLEKSLMPIHMQFIKSRFKGEQVNLEETLQRGIAASLPSSSQPFAPLTELGPSYSLEIAYGNEYDNYLAFLKNLNAKRKTATGISAIISNKNNTYTLTLTHKEAITHEGLTISYFNLGRQPEEGAEGDAVYFEFSNIKSAARFLEGEHPNFKDKKETYSVSPWMKTSEAPKPSGIAEPLS